MALGNLPPAPAAPFKVEAASSTTSITIAWTAVTSTDNVPITGYQVYIDDGQNGNFKQVYDGANKPLLNHFTAVGLVTGLAYRFTVVSMNINGVSS